MDRDKGGFCTPGSAETGPADALLGENDYPVPEMKDGQVLVKNEFAGINFIDTCAPLPPARQQPLTGQRWLQIVTEQRRVLWPNGGGTALVAQGAATTLSEPGM